jgi:hypothetical protein
MVEVWWKVMLDKLITPLILIADHKLSRTITVMHRILLVESWLNQCKRKGWEMGNRKVPSQQTARISIRILKTMKIYVETTYNRQTWKWWLISNILFWGKIDIHSLENMEFTRKIYSNKGFSVEKDINYLIWNKLVVKR